MRNPLERLRAPIVPIEPRPEFADALLRRIEGATAASARTVPPVQGAPTVRYFVDDLDAAVRFYRDALGFEVELRPSPVFAMLYRGDLRLLLSVPGEPHVLPDGTVPQPGGHNRISLRVEDLSAAVRSLREQGTRFRTGIAAGVSVTTILLEDPAGNPVELFEPGPGYHERAARGPAPRDTPPTEEEDR